MKFTFEEKLAAVKLHKEKEPTNIRKDIKPKAEKQRTDSMSGSGKHNIIVAARMESGMD